MFGKEITKILGHVISSAGMATDPEKITRVAQWPISLNKQELRQFLGFVNYYRRFVQDCVSIAKPLYQLTECNKLFKCTTQDCFVILHRVPYGGKLWCHQNLTKFMTDQKFVKFSPSKFLHFYRVSCEH